MAFLQYFSSDCNEGKAVCQNLHINSIPFSGMKLEFQSINELVLLPSFVLSPQYIFYGIL